MTILEKVNILILLVTISYIMALGNILASIEEIEPQIGWLITFLTSVGLFRLLILLVYWLIHRSDALLALYHRNRFIKGLWTYSYEANDKRHVGIWRISQDVSSLVYHGLRGRRGRQDGLAFSQHQSAFRASRCRRDHVRPDRHRKRRRTLFQINALHRSAQLPLMALRADRHPGPIRSLWI
jgi:hypothetical protein